MDHNATRRAARTACASLFLALLVSCTLPSGNVGSRTSDPDAGADDAEFVITGEAEVLIADYPDGARIDYYLRTLDGERILLDVDATPDQIAHGDKLEVDGTWLDSARLSVSNFVSSGTIHALGDTRREPEVRRVAVILLEGTRYTRAQALEQVTGGANTAADYIAENSNGTVTFEGEVFGPYSIDTSNCGERANQIARDAKAAARSDGHNLDGFRHVAIIIPPQQGCGWGGLGHVGRPGGTAQLTTWYNNWFDCLVVSHEIGHNLGMIHSHSTNCGDKTYRADRDDCTDKEYGHEFDVMGKGRCAHGHFSAPQKQYLGWLDACEDVTAGGSGTFRLSPIESECGLRSVRVPIGGENSYYYLEYRSVDAGDYGGARGESRVVLSVSNDGASARPDVYLLDGSPATTSMQDAWLAPGVTHSLPGGVGIRVVELGEEALVQVTTNESGPATCRNGDPSPVDGAGTVTSTCSGGGDTGGGDTGGGDTGGGDTGGGDTGGGDTGGGDSERIDVANLSGASGSIKRYQLIVPEGGHSVVFTLTPGTGDPDLYVRRGAEPTTGTFDCRPYKADNTGEVCNFDRPGTYHVMIRGYKAYSGWRLTGTYQTGGGDDSGGDDGGGSVLNGDGLRGTYYNRVDFTRQKLVRVDPRIDFAWGRESPDASMGADTFSVRWEGELQVPWNGTYTFYTLSDDGVRVWIDGNLLIEDWSDHAPRERSGAVNLRAGQRYSIRVDYYERGGGATMKLLWSGPGISKRLVPKKVLYSP